MKTFNLKKPIHKDGQEIKQVQLDFDNLTGADIIDAERELMQRGNVNMNAIYSAEGAVVMVAKASTPRLVFEDITALAAADFLEVTTAAKGFLLGLDLQPNTL